MKQALQFHYFFRCVSHCAEEFLLYTHEQCLALCPALLNPAPSQWPERATIVHFVLAIKRACLINRVYPYSSRLRHRNTAVCCVWVGDNGGVNQCSKPVPYTVSLSFWHVMLVFNLIPAWEFCWLLNDGDGREQHKTSDDSWLKLASATIFDAAPTSDYAFILSSVYFTLH